MKALITILLVSLVATISLSAKRDDPSPAITRKMKSAGEKYVKLYLAEFPDSAKGLSSSKARKKHYELLEASKILTVDGPTQTLLRRRKEIVSDVQMQNLVKNLAEDDSNDTKFLLKLAVNDKLKGEGRLLIFRLLGRADKQFKEKKEQDAIAKAEEFKKVLAQVYEHFKSKSEELGRLPSDTEELALPESLTTALGKDWVYIGSRMFVREEEARILFFNTVAEANGTTQTLNSEGKVLQIKHEALMEQWNKVKDKPAPKPATDKKKTEKKSDDKPDAKMVEDFEEKLLKDFTSVFKRIVDKHNESSIWPISLEGAGVSGDLLTAQAPDGKERKPWLYVAGKARIPVSENQFIILVSPYPRGENYLAALSDGKIVNLSASKFKEVKKLVSGK